MQSKATIQSIIKINSRLQGMINHMITLNKICQINFIITKYNIESNIYRLHSIRKIWKVKQTAKWMSKMGAIIRTREWVQVICQWSKGYLIFIFKLIYQNLNLTIDNAKTWQVEKDIKSAKESIFVSLRKYVKKETYQEQLKDIENKINSSNDGIIKQKVEIERIDRALDLINAKITK